jgi:hypothetical protein
MRKMQKRIAKVFVNPDSKLGTTHYIGQGNLGQQGLLVYMSLGLWVLWSMGLSVFSYLDRWVFGSFGVLVWGYWSLSAEDFPSTECIDG